MTEDTARRDGQRSELALLRAHEPDRARSARVRARCHAEIDKRRRQALPSAWPGWRRAFEPAIAGTLCAVYLLEVLSRAIRLYRF